MPHHTTYVRFQSVSLKRLAADIEDFETDFARYRVGAAKDDNTWVESCSAHLANAKEALAECDANLGYQYLGNAERDAVPLMPEDERRARADSLRTELKYKLDNWRRKAASLLLKPENPENVSAEAIREALFHRNTQSQNIYWKIELVRQQLTFICGLLWLLLLIPLIIGAFGGLAMLNQKSGFDLLPLAIYMGVLGGTLSAAISVTHTDASTKIPDVQRTRAITLARSALGGGAAVAVFLLIQSNVGKGLDSTSSYSLLFFCFLSGFSERWFLSALDKLSKDTADKSKKG